VAGSLRRAGDTRFPMVATGLAIWLVRLPFGWLFGVPLHGGLPGLYISNVLDSAVRAVATYARFQRSAGLRGASDGDASILDYSWRGRWQ